MDIGEFIMRARNIKPGLYSNEDLAECSIAARYIFPGLWMFADRAGRMEYRPKKIKAALLPFDAIEIEPLLSELERWGFIRFYRVGTVDYIEVINFDKHQHPHYKEPESRIPGPDDTDQIPGPDGQSSPDGRGEIPGLDGQPSVDDRGQSPGLNGQPSVDDRPMIGGKTRLIPDTGIIDSNEKRRPRTRANSTPPAKCKDADDWDKPLPDSVSVAQQLIEWERQRGHAPRGVGSSHAKTMEIAKLTPTRRQLRDAYVAAVDVRDRDGDKSPIPSGLVLTMLTQQRTRAAAPKPLRSMSDAELNAEASRLGTELRPGWSRDECIDRLTTRRAEVAASAGAMR